MVTIFIQFPQATINVELVVILVNNAIILIPIVHNVIQEEYLTKLQALVIVYMGIMQMEH